MKEEALSSSQVLSRNRAVPRSGAAPRSKWVSFSGVDGAGKSTQIAALCDAMESMGRRVHVIRFWDDVARLHRFREAAATGIFKSERGVGAPGAPVNRRDKNVRSPLMSCVRMGLYLIDAVSLRMTVKRACRSGFDVIVFDRFIYDELANLNLKNPVVRFYIRCIMAVVPRPDISYVLDADPVAARARKPEYPLDFLYLNREAYLTLSRLVGRVTVIDPMPVEEVRQEILKHGAELLAGKDRNHVS